MSDKEKKVEEIAKHCCFPCGCHNILDYVGGESDDRN